jgi:hypothetical protein
LAETSGTTFGYPIKRLTIPSLWRANQKRKRHLQVERLVTDPPQPDPKPSSSLDFLAALREEYRAQQQQELGQLHFSRLTHGDASSQGEDDPDAGSNQPASEEA